MMGREETKEEREEGRAEGRKGRRKVVTGKKKQPKNTTRQNYNQQAVGIFQCKICSQYGYFSSKYSARRDISVQNIQPVGIFQYKIFSQ
jgi:hypothetical protein